MLQPSWCSGATRGQQATRGDLPCRSRKSDHPSGIWRRLPAAGQNYIIDLVNLILSEANLLSASDIHLLPTAAGLEVRWRIDGVLQLAGILPRVLAPNVVARLKVLAEHADLSDRHPPGGADPRVGGGDVEMRVSTFPTYYGEKAVVRLFGGSGRYLRLDDLGLPDEIRETLVAAPRTRPRARSCSAGPPGAARPRRSMPACASWSPPRRAAGAW